MKNKHIKTGAKELIMHVILFQAFIFLFNYKIPGNILEIKH